MDISKALIDEFSWHYHGGSAKVALACARAIEHYKKDGFKGCELKDIMTSVGHDGYDAYGPESNLFNVHICYTKPALAGSNVFVDVWHDEQWFHDNETLDLEKMTSWMLETKEYTKFVKNFTPDEDAVMGPDSSSDDECLYSMGGYEDCLS